MHARLGHQAGELQLLAQSGDSSVPACGGPFSANKMLRILSHIEATEAEHQHAMRCHEEDSGLAVHWSLDMTNAPPYLHMW